MEVSGVRRSWETLAICLRKLSSRLRRTRVSRSLSSSRPLIWDSSSSSLSSGLYSRRRVPGTMRASFRSRAARRRARLRRYWAYSTAVSRMRERMRRISIGETSYGIKVWTEEFRRLRAASYFARGGSSSQSPLDSVSAWWRKLRSFPCSSSSRRTHFVGLRREVRERLPKTPPGTRPLDTSCPIGPLSPDPITGDVLL